MKTNYIWLFIIGTYVLTGCDLEELPVATTSKNEIFGTETGLNLYSNSFYNALPSGNDIVTEDYLSDINARKDRIIFLTEGAFNATSTEAGWDWGSLRNINFFLSNNEDPAVPVQIRQHYNALAKFWRAWFYYEKVKRFGDVPWINKPLDVSDPQLHAGRDPRIMVMDSVIADLNYAIEHINGNDASRTLVTRDVALAFKSRICLYEGTFRKYHSELGLSGTVDAWLTESANASRILMDENNYSIFTGAGTELSYRQLFTRVSPVASEIIFGRAWDIGLGLLHGANWHYTSSTYGVQLSPIRTFIQTYLMTDGTPFTDIEGHETMVFSEEVKNRDHRLKQSIRTGDYTRISGNEQVSALPQFSYTLTGYYPIKWSLDDMYYDSDTRNDNFVSIFRFGEILLNYAEAKAELGTLTDADWAETVGVLRARAGISGGLDAKPTVADPYLQSTFFPNISDPAILEIRRERSIELYLEVSRFDDIRRWKRGELMEMPWDGIYVPTANQPMDLNDDGVFDVYFYYGELPPVGERIPGVSYLNITPSPGNLRTLSNGTSGEILWLTTQPRTWEDKLYHYPIPERHRILNPNLGQNPGW
ncbi:MAG: RagB/SusD family nutrient uptake outer membrane protein [Cyclobacteriaceae bacterium]